MITTTSAIYGCIFILSILNLGCIFKASAYIPLSCCNNILLMDGQTHRPLSIFNRGIKNNKTNKSTELKQSQHSQVVITAHTTALNASTKKSRKKRRRRQKQTTTTKTTTSCSYISLMVEITHQNNSNDPMMIPVDDNKADVVKISNAFRAASVS